MARRVEIDGVTPLRRHEQYAHLEPLVRALREEASPFAGGLAGHTLWMISSTAQGGGVAEMLPGVVTHLRELGIDTEWAVIEADDESFFHLTKRIHNMLHGDGVASLTGRDRELFEHVSRLNAAEMRAWIRPGDVVIVHDPQPMPIASMLRETVPVTTVWRCHIGLDQANDATDAAWRFLQPYAGAYEHAVFSAPEYVPPFFEGRSSIIYPALDPLTDKNRPLRVKSVVAILERAGLTSRAGPPLDLPYDRGALRLQPDGTWSVAHRPDDLGLLSRPIITQVSRWDRLKGFLPLMQGFARLKERAARGHDGDDRTDRILARCRLVLAGPEPDSIADDPEGREVLSELTDAYLRCSAGIRPDIAIIALPMHDPAVNALIVNALQRVSTIAVQNSLREGFGLTITEAMWKGVPVLTNSRACGPRQQVRDGIDGRLIADPEDVDLIARALESMLTRGELDDWGRSAEQRVHEHFLIYSQLRHWVRLLRSLTEDARAA